jgi:hypothetical protein
MLAKEIFFSAGVLLIAATHLFFRWVLNKGGGETFNHVEFRKKPSCFLSVKLGLSEASEQAKHKWVHDKFSFSFFCC